MLSVFFYPNETLLLGQKWIACPLQVQEERLQQVDEIKWGTDGSGHWQRDWSRGEWRAEPKRANPNPKGWAKHYLWSPALWTDPKKKPRKKAILSKIMFPPRKKKNLTLVHSNFRTHTHTHTIKHKTCTNHFLDIASVGDKVVQRQRGNIKV